MAKSIKSTKSTKSIKPAAKKRTYKHSDAWIAKHAAKADAKKPHKQMAKVEKKPMKKTEKPLKKQRKQTAKEVVKKTAKTTMKPAQKLFDKMKKNVSAVKADAKTLGKFMTEAMKTGDQKYIERIGKMFARINFCLDHDESAVYFKTTGKVKLPKQPNAKIQVEQPIADKPKRQRKQNAKITVEAVVPPSVTDTCPTDEELAEIEANDEIQELEEFDVAEAEAARRDDETDDEFNDRIREEREIEREMAEAEADFKAEIFAAQEDNGDI